MVISPIKRDMLGNWLHQQNLALYIKTLITLKELNLDTFPFKGTIFRENTEFFILDMN